MTNADTSLGGNLRRFPSTCWSRFVGGFGRGAGPDRAAIEELSTSYWKPVYTYVRAKWSKSNEDAKDLTQDFFLWMMETDFAGRADRSRGRFRAFVKTALEHYLVDQERMRRREKRGGNQTILPLEKMAGEPEGLEIPDRRGRSPDELLDDAWRNQLFARAEQKLEETLRAEGKEVYFAVFRDYYLSDAEDLNYQQAGAKHGISAVDVSNYLMHAKRRYQAVLTDLVAETVDSEEELRAELKALFGEEAT